MEVLGLHLHVCVCGHVQVCVCVCVCTGTRYAAKSLDYPWASQLPRRFSVTVFRGSALPAPRVKDVCKGHCCSAWDFTGFVLKKTLIVPRTVTFRRYFFIYLGE